MLPKEKGEREITKRGNLTLLVKPKGADARNLGRSVEDEETMKNDVELRLGGPLEAFIGFGQNVLVGREQICNVMQLG
jgi:hypothetical protein